MAQQQGQQQIQIEFPTALRGGVYSNNMMVSHTAEEFIMDFLMVAPPAGTVMARVVMSPGHVKRTIAALQDNLRKYEEQFGKVKEAAAPNRDSIGFGKN